MAAWSMSFGTLCHFVDLRVEVFITTHRNSRSERKGKVVVLLQQ